jgi:hypothetical protein
VQGTARRGYGGGGTELLRSFMPLFCPEAKQRACAERESAEGRGLPGGRTCNGASPGKAGNRSMGIEIPQPRVLSALNMDHPLSKT